MSCLVSTARDPDTAIFSATILGLTANDSIVGIDYRPATGQLYALGIGGGAAGSGRLYTIEPNSTFATLVGTLAADPADATAPFTGFTGTSFGFDFNPVVDRLRIVSNTEENLRVNPNTGLVTTDTALNPAGSVVGSAYDRNFAGTGATTLFGIDSDTNQLVRQGDVNGTPTSPNAGVITPIGALGVATTLNLLGFDIDGKSGVAFALLNTGAAPRRSSSQSI